MDIPQLLHRFRGLFGKEAVLRKGEIRRRERRLHREDGYFSRITSGERQPNLDNVSTCLAGLGTHIPRFFQRVFSVDADNLLATLYPDKDEPEMVGELRGIGRPLLLEMPKSVSTSGPAEAPAVRAVPQLHELKALSHRPRQIRDLLSHLDRLRYAEPRWAAQVAHILTRDVIPEVSDRAERLALFCWGLGSLGSAHRVAGNLARSSYCLRLALQLGEHQGLPDGTREDLWQRATFVLSDHGQYEDAFAVVSDAGRSRLARGDWSGVAKVFQIQGNLRILQGQPKESLGLLQIAAAGLPSRLHDWHSANDLSIAVVHSMKGDLIASRDYSRRASQRLLPTQLLTRALLLRLEGTVVARQRNWRAGEAYLREAQTLIAAINVFDLALITLDLVHLLFVSGQPKRAAHEAHTMMKILEPIHGKSKLAGSALVALIVAARAGALTDQLITKTQEVVTRERFRPRKVNT